MFCHTSIVINQMNNRYILIHTFNKLVMLVAPCRVPGYLVNVSLKMGTYINLLSVLSKIYTCLIVNFHIACKM